MYNISIRKSLFSSGVHTELREQKSRSRNVALIQGNLIGNARILFREIRGTVQTPVLFVRGAFRSGSALHAYSSVILQRRNSLLLSFSVQISYAPRLHTEVSSPRLMVISPVFPSVSKKRSIIPSSPAAFLTAET